jgi:hypothetical protein
MHVLEIGAGTGVFTLPLSEKVASMTVVEPSPSMIRILDQKLRLAGRKNVTIVQSRWEDADIAAHDAVLAAGCLYVFYDIRAVLEKMIGSAAKLVIMTTGVNRWSAIYEEAAQMLAAKVPASGPDLIHLYNALHHMGILADVRVIESTADLVFDDLDHAANTWAERLRLPEEKKVKLRRFLLERLKTMPSGQLSLGEVNHLNAVVWFPIDRTHFTSALPMEPVGFPF